MKIKKFLKLIAPAIITASLVFGFAWSAGPVTPIVGGGTGTSSAPTKGKLLMGNASSTYDLVSTSSLGIIGNTATTTFASSTITGSGTTTVNYVIGGNLNVGGNLYGNGQYLTGITGGYFIPGTNGLYYSSSTKPYVGIGTSTPSSLLSIWGDQSNQLTITVATTNNAIDAGITLRGGGAVPSTHWVLHDDDSDSDKFKIATSSTDMGLFVIGSDGYAKFQIPANSSTSMEIKQSDTSYLTVDTSTDDPKIVFGKNAEIGTMQIDRDSGGVNFVDMSITASSTAGTANNLSIALDGNAILTVYASSTGNGMIEQMRVGISTTTPLAKLEIRGTASTTGDLLRISTSSIYAMVIDGMGNVGIGTTTATSPLTVIGVSRMTGLVSCDTIDTDASGIMSCGSDDSTAGSGATTSINGVELVDFAFTTSSDTNIGLNISQTAGGLLFAPTWISTLADGRIASASNWNATKATVDASSSNWTTAYDWGDHSLAGYLTSYASTTWGNLIGTITDQLDLISYFNTKLATTTAASTYVARADWTTIDSYPAACSAGQYVSTIGDTLTCSAPSAIATTTFNSIANAGNGTTSGNQVITGNLNVGGNLVASASSLFGLATTTFGTISGGVWQGTAVADGYIASATKWNAGIATTTFNSISSPTAIITSATTTNATTSNAYALLSQTIPYGASPDVGSLGKIALDTTTGQLKVMATSTLVFVDWKTKEKTILEATTTDDGIPLAVFFASSTVSNVYCKTSTSTVAIVLGDGTNNFESITCTTAGATDDGSITNATFGATEMLQYDTGTIGTPDGIGWLFISWKYRVDAD